jgi:hypothetical protein
MLHTIVAKKVQQPHHPSAIYAAEILRNGRNFCCIHLASDVLLAIRTTEMHMNRQLVHSEWPPLCALAAAELARTARQHGIAVEREQEGQA